MVALFGFGLGISNLRVDLIPKIGVWSFDSILPATFDESGRVETTAAFSLSRKFSGGGEVGLESEFGSFLMRAWYGVDVAFSLFGLLGTQSVTSNRFG